MTSPYLTGADVDAAIVSVAYTVLPDGHTTVCSLHLDNGCWVHGMSHSAVPAAEHAEVTQQGAFGVARREVWQLILFRAADRARAP